MNIFYVTKESFPYGEACTNRVLTYAIDMARQGHKLTVICLMLLSDRNKELLDKNGRCVYEDINIIYAAGSKQWPSRGTRKLYKLWLLICAYINSILIIYKNRKEIDVLHMISAEIFMFNLYGKVAKLLHIPYAVERSELPDYIKNKNKFETTKKGLEYIEKSKKSFKLFDGWLLETQTLVDYYSQFYREDIVLCVTPMSVEVDRFALPKQPSQYGRYIAYCGNMLEVDGISILIKAFNQIREEFKDVNLVFVGDSQDVPDQKKLVVSLGLEKRVLFLGKIFRDEVPQFLCNAEVLALASPTSDRSCATMPCKVGEYLSTGNPVVVTGLGEINKYLKDGESAYLSKPDSEEAFAQKLREALSDPAIARVIGEKGREVAAANFSSTNLTKEIVNFYQQLTKKK